MYLTIIYQYKLETKKEQRKGMIDMIFMIRCINFFLYFILIILWLTFCSNILLLLSALTSPTSVMVFVLGEFIQRLKFPGQTSDRIGHTLLAISLRLIWFFSQF